MEKKEVKEQLEIARKSMGFVPEIQQLVGEQASEWFKLYRDSDEARCRQIRLCLRRLRY